MSLHEDLHRIDLPILLGRHQLHTAVRPKPKRRTDIKVVHAQLHAELTRGLGGVLHLGLLRRLALIALGPVGVGAEDRLELLARELPVDPWLAPVLHTF